MRPMDLMERIEARARELRAGEQARTAAPVGSHLTAVINHGPHQVVVDLEPAERDLPALPASEKRPDESPDLSNDAEWRSVVRKLQRIEREIEDLGGSPSESIATLEDITDPEERLEAMVDTIEELELHLKAAELGVRLDER